jgi:hypothetical protein
LAACDGRADGAGLAEINFVGKTEAELTGACVP